MAPITPVDGAPQAADQVPQEPPVSTVRSRAVAQSPALRFLLTAVGKLVLSLVAISALVFVASAAIPGDPARAILGKDATASQITAFRQTHGLDEGVLTQYGKFLGNALHGDFGVSYAANNPVQDVIGQRLERTLILVLFGWVAAALVAVPIGLASGKRRGRRSDMAVSLVTLAIGALPEFVIAILLVLVFGVWLKIFPVDSSAVGFASNPFDAASSYVLPAVTVALTIVPYVIRLTRANAREVVSEPYIRSAVLRGVGGWRLTNRHILTNAAPPVVNVLALQFVGSIGGVVVTETVFGFPGLGQLLVQSVGTRDLPVVQAIALILGLFFVVVNILADAIVVLLTPKLRGAGR
jgi:peptide/nickel transport system permease protein